MQRTLCYFLFVLICSFSCSEEESIEKRIANGGKVYGGSISYESPESVNYFFPLSATSMYEQRAIAPIFETLMTYDEESKSLSGNLISSYTISEDMKTIDLIVKKGVHFHKDPCFRGKKEMLTASDVKFTLDYACSSHDLNKQSQLLVGKIKGAKEFYNSFNGDFSKGVDGIQVLSEFSLRIELSNPSPTFLKILTHQSISVFSKKAYDFYKENIIYHPIGTGPFKLASKDKKERSYLRNDNYWKYDEYNNQLPFLDEIKIKQGSMAGAFSSFTTQKTDLLLSVPANKINSLFGTLDEAKDGKNILHKLQYRKGLKINYIGFDCSQPPFNDVHLRLAIFHAINRDFICSEFLYGETNPAQNGILPDGAYFKPTSKPQKSYSINLARYHMRKSKYNGDSLAFFVSTNTESETKWSNSLIKELKSSLGLKVKIITGTYAEKIKSIQNGDSKMWLGAYVPDYPDAESYLSPYYSLNVGTSLRAFGKFKNSLFDQTFEKSSREVDEAKRNELFNTCIQIMNTEAPVVPIYFENLLVVYNLSLRDANMNSFGIIDFSKAYLKPIK